MDIKYLNTLLSIVLYGTTSICSPIEDSYTIEMPMSINVNENGSFDVSLSNYSLNTNESINIDFSDTFVLSDSHGKEDISGIITNPHICFDENDSNTKVINYSVNGLTPGEWSGELGVSISLNKYEETNVLIDGPALNAILSELSPTTLTFSHEIIEGDYSYDLSSAKDESILLYQKGAEVIITNCIDSPIKTNEDMSYAFSNLIFTKLNHLDYLDTSNCINMSHMFEGVSGIKTLDVSSFNTSNVNNMSYMFSNMTKCTSLLGMENFNVENVIDLSYLLYNSMKLQSVPDLTGWDVTNKCINIAYMMANVAYTANRNGYSKWPSSVDYSNWDVSGVTNMSHTFRNAFMIQTLDLSNWNTSNVTDMSGMFEMVDNTEKSRLTTIIGLQTNENIWNVTNVVDMSYMFNECRSLINVDIDSWKPTSVTSLVSTFSGATKLDLHILDPWKGILDFNKIDTTNCFAEKSGYEAGGYIPWNN